MAIYNPFALAQLFLFYRYSMYQKKILFVENKFKTLFWDEIAKRLIAQGHDVHWIVQNRLFYPKHGTVHQIFLPSEHDLTVANNAIVGEDVFFQRLSAMDRSVYFYNNTDRHYSYYLQKISDILTYVGPDFVFGETTLFHELMTVELCRRQNILYLHPTSCRYPSGRFSFYLYDSLQPYIERKDCVIVRGDQQVEHNIVSRRVQPDYMASAVKKKKSFSEKYRFYKNLGFSLLSRWSGERYNTPSLRQKMDIEGRLKVWKQRWEEELASASDDIKDWSKILVVPLQMQPEANIDVWGHPHNDQLSNIKTLYSGLPEGWSLAIKPNPKAKYELSEALMDFIRETDNVYAFSHNEGMEAIFNKADVFYSVSGTVAIEALMAGKAGYCSGLPIVSVFNPNLHRAPQEVDVSQAGTDKKAVMLAPGQVIAYLRTNSYAGVIGDPITAPFVVEDENLAQVTAAFADVVADNNSNA